MLFPSSFSVLPLVQPLPSACSLAAAHGWKRPTVGQRRGCSSPAANPPTANSNSQQPAASSAQPTSRRQHSFPRALLSPPFARLATAPLATAAWSWSDFPPTPTTPCPVLVGASPRAARGVDDHAVEKPPGTVAVTQPKTPWGKKGGHCPTRHPRWRSIETPGRRYLFTWLSPSTKDPNDKGRTNSVFRSGSSHTCIRALCRRCHASRCRLVVAVAPDFRSTLPGGARRLRVVPQA